MTDDDRTGADDADLVYGVLGGELVFMHRLVAEQRYGRGGYGISGPYLSLFAKDEATIVAEFLAAGYRVKRDDDLVAGAMNTMAG